MIIKQRNQENKIVQMDLVGNVKDKVWIVVDDMIDSGGTSWEAVANLIHYGAKEVYFFWSHGLFSKNAFELIEKSPVK